MIAVSSFRSLDEDPEYRDNQIAANQTWRAHFDGIRYVNKPDARLDSDKTKFLIDRDDFPTIDRLCEICSMLPGWSCIINADIIIGPLFRMAEHRLLSCKAQCAVSARWNFDPKVGTHLARITDQGLDFFAACPEIWRKAALSVPKEFRIGHSMWDTWMLGFFKKVAGGYCWDISRQRVIFHPIHSGRRQPHAIPNIIDKDVMRAIAQPIPQL